MKNFWSNKKVLITGHTGFKGSWLTMILANFDAKLFGYSLPPTSTPNMFEALHIEDFMESSFYGDINDKSAFHNYLKDSDPEIIFHLAAQPIVNYSYQDPIGTYQTNVMGLLNLLEISKQIQSVETIVIVTSDKCYENKEIDYSYIETDKLGGYDPYSSSKAAAEILIQSYRQSFLEQSEHYSLSSARAGNVIGGGDWSMDRLIPDIVRYQYHEAELKLRYPNCEWVDVFSKKDLNFEDELDIDSAIEVSAYRDEGVDRLKDKLLNLIP